MYRLLGHRRRFNWPTKRCIIIVICAAIIIGTIGPCYLISSVQWSFGKTIKYRSEEFTYDDYPFTWQCEKSLCVKRLWAKNTTQPQQSLNVCMLRCSNHSGLWPRPRRLAIHQDVVPINHNRITFHSRSPDGNSLSGTTSEMVQEMTNRFMETISEMGKNSVQGLWPIGRGQSMIVTLLIGRPEQVSLTQSTNESYSLTLIQIHLGQVHVTIRAPTYFGVRHGLETLSQLIVYDFVSGSLVTPREVVIYDRPAYPYRGILLDTARNYIPVSVLHRVIDGMAANKLNTFHWHITDSQSFPFQSTSFPQMSKYGAYSPNEVYTEEDILGLVEFARVRGVRILPELDAPAHVGEGWQWADPYEAVVCFNKQPWKEFCAEPPCGQINPTNNYVYHILKGIYSDMDRLFDSDLFHMGGDEVNFNCWNTTKTITNWMIKNDLPLSEDGFHQLWGRFQSRALTKLDSVSKAKHQVVVWTSTLTDKERVSTYLSPSRYIIQLWTQGNNSVIADLVNDGYKVIFSNHDALYFDCGFGAWVGNKTNNWCSPYIGWQKVYENRPLELLQKLDVDTSKEEIRQQILGQEAAMWTEEADDQVVDQRLWPRAAAMAERLWSDPEQSWRDAEHRFLYHRERMVDRGIPADVAEPLWCLQNQGQCY